MAHVCDLLNQQAELNAGPEFARNESINSIHRARHQNIAECALWLKGQYLQVALLHNYKVAWVYILVAWQHFKQRRNMDEFPADKINQDFLATAKDEGTDINTGLPAALAKPIAQPVSAAAAAAAIAANAGSGAGGASTTTAPTKKTPRVPLTPCPNCNKIGHWRRDCPTSSTHPYQRGGGGN